MWDRTYTVGSAGKTFSVTGWKVCPLPPVFCLRPYCLVTQVGWVIGPKHLVSAAVLSHQRIAFCVATPLQEAVAIGFEDAPKHDFFKQQQQMLASKRQIVLDVLDEVGISYTKPQGAYFVLFDTTNFNIAPADEPRDWTICKTLTKDIGVAAIPPSAFYSEKSVPLAANYARFCFCKKDELLHEAARRLRSNLPSILIQQQ